MADVLACYRVPGTLLSVQRGRAWLSPPAVVAGGSTIYDSHSAEVETEARRDDEAGMGRAARAQGELGFEPRLFSDTCSDSGALALCCGIRS